MGSLALLVTATSGPFVTSLKLTLCLQQIAKVVFSEAELTFLEQLFRPPVYW